MSFFEPVFSHFATVHKQPTDAIGSEVIYYENNSKLDGQIVGYLADVGQGKHVIKLENDQRIQVSLKSARDKGQVVVIEKRCTLNNIQYPKNYLYLYLSKESPRYKCWKPTYYNDPARKPMKDRDKLEFNGSEKSIRRDWAFQQKFGYAKCKYHEWNGFLRLMIGAGYELSDGTIIGVKDVICTRGSQVVQYFNILQFGLVHFK